VVKVLPLGAAVLSVAWQRSVNMEGFHFSKSEITKPHLNMT